LTVGELFVSQAVGDYEAVFYGDHDCKLVEEIGEVCGSDWPTLA